MATLKDVATMAEVSTSTASRILHGGSIRVSDATRSRVLDAARELSYRPNTLARSLRTRVTNTIGVLLTDVQNPLYAQMIARTEEAAAARGYSLILMSGRSDDRRKAFMDLMTPDRVDGFLIADASFPSEWVTRFSAKEIPMVMVNHGGIDRVASVCLDDEAGARLAIEHLLELGHREIAYLAAPQTSDVGRRRLKGTRDALAEAGIQLAESRWYECGFAGEGAAAAIDRLLWSKEPISAIATAGVVTSMLALKALIQRGVKVPSEMSLMGFHDTPFIQYVTPDITTIRMPIEQLASCAIDLLVGQIQGEPPRQLKVDQPKPLLIRRQSVMPFNLA